MGTLTGSALVCLLLALVAALVDWWSVARSRQSVEYVAKPAVLVLLIAAATTMTPADSTVRWVFVVGLTFGLIGDVFLMLDQFIPGAAAFLLGHFAYIVGFLLVPLQAIWIVVGLVLFVLLAVIVGRPVVVGAGSRSSVLAAIVIAYLLALGAVLVLGLGSAVPAAMAGVVLFSLSDALLAYGRFVGPAPGGRVLVHATYHVAQALLVVALTVLN